MSQDISHIELNKNSTAAIQELNAALLSLSHIFKNLPVSELIKNKRLQKAVKEKAAWYACIVNPNIDVLLLQEYFESKQSRNILLKKETEQYQGTVNHLSELKTLTTNVSVYENLIAEKTEEVNSFDLFSAPAVVKQNCPAHVVKMFAEWELKVDYGNHLEKTLSQFCEWHTLNNFSFNGQRRLILWFNYQLWKMFGDASLLINVEHYFYHQWNQESRQIDSSIKSMLEFMQEACSALEMELKALYRAEIKFDSLEPLQKIANNYLYYTGFNIEDIAVNTEDYSIQLNKLLLKKGFICSEEINYKLVAEKVKLTVQNWYKAGLVDVVINDGNWYAYMKSTNTKSNRLQSFSNVNYQSHEPDWNKLLMKPTIQLQSSEIQVEATVKSAITRQKAFFG
ncbi:MAG: hypothetical protein PSX81_01490 [bacterium]|nr:hypothetical protein [bacterium]